MGFAKAILALTPELELKAWQSLGAHVDRKASCERDCADCGKALVGIHNRQARSPACARKHARPCIQAIGWW